MPYCSDIVMLDIKKGKIFTSSLDVARDFNKRHKDVLKRIRSLDASAQFIERNFAPYHEVSSKGNEYQAYNITRDGFAFLAMGFTGRKAAAWKERYIDAFNRLEEEIQSRQSQAWLESRKAGIAVRNMLTEAIGDFVSYAIGQGSNNAKRYFVNISKMVKDEMFDISYKHLTDDQFRNNLNPLQLSQLATAEGLVSRALREGMARGDGYKDIYQACKKVTKEYVSMIHTSLVPLSFGRMISHAKKK